ncbi:coiled-coil domain-containing protein [Campylobacter coli]|uniref:coiled-coil domain-containing protein n=1 Tax=Campylobacter coli TaxID=195 RepID=UPI004034D37C
MTAYVHIGTEKTGTTSIQEFLYINKSIIQKQNYFFAQSIGIKNHWDLAFLGYSLNKKDSYILNNSLWNFQAIKQHKKNIFSKIKDEVKFNHKIIFSSELLQSRLTRKREIVKLYTFFKKIGFTNIKVICYIRDANEMLRSLLSEAIKWEEIDSFELKEEKEEYKLGYKKNLFHFHHICNHKQTLQWWGEVFGKENLIVRLFDKNEFYQGDLLKDFIHSIGLEWDDEFIIPPKQNESLDLLGIDLLRRINKFLPLFCNNARNIFRGDLHRFAVKHFTSKDSHLKFQPPKEVVQSYIDYFEESNEWVRKEFFPHKERLFPKKDLTDYKENYELKEMKPEYWDKIADFVVDVVETKNKTIQENLSQINNLNQTIETKNKTIQENLSQINNLNQTIETKNKTIQENLSQINNLNQTIETKNKTIQENLSQINNLNQTIETKNKTIQENLSQINNLNQTIETKNKTIQNKDDLLNFQAQYGTAKSRIQNQLSYKLGQTMIVNSKSFLGCLLMPVILLGIVISHKQEQKIYKRKIEKDPSLKLPSLEQYPDYREAIKLKNHLSYKLGKELVKANKIWYKGGYFYFLYFIKKIKI